MAEAVTGQPKPGKGILTGLDWAGPGKMELSKDFK